MTDKEVLLRAIDIVDNSDMYTNKREIQVEVLLNLYRLKNYIATVKNMEKP